MRRSRLIPLAVVAAVLALPGCTQDGSAPEAAPDATPTVAYTAEVPVIAPDRPGEPAETVAPGETGSYADSAVRNDADVLFVRHMIVHHEQALVMSALAPQRAESDTVRRLAERIHAAQGPEAEAMRGWLVSEGVPVDDPGGEHAGHSGHAAAGAGGSMPGMASEEDMAALAAATGGEFDRRFLELMIAHHEGALVMAEEVLAEGRHVLIQELANDVTITQSVEIDRMREVLGRL